MFWGVASSEVERVVRAVDMTLMKRPPNRKHANSWSRISRNESRGFWNG